MKSFVPHPIISVATFPLRSFEAERQFQKHTLSALIMATALCAMAIGIYLFVPERNKVLERPAIPFYPLPPPFFSDPFPSQLPVGRSPSNVKSGIPIPVPIVEAEDQNDFAAPKDLGSSGSVGGDGIGEGDDKRVGGEPGREIFTIEEEAPMELHLVEREPVLVRRVTPKYPELLQRAEIEGKVVVRLWVDKEGKVREAHVQHSTNEMFNDAAIEAAKQFLFTPAYMNAGPVSVWVSVPFTFRLH